MQYKIVFIIVTAVTLRASADENKLAKAVNLEKLNTEADEDDPFLAPDGNLYFASNKAGNWQLMVAKKTTGGFGAGKPYLSSKDADYRCPFVIQGILYFADNTAPAENKDLKNFDIVKKIGQRPPMPLPGISEKDDELHPWITSAGKEFYFSRKAADGWMQFVAAGPVPGPIGKAKEVGFPSGFHHATLAKSGLLMYLQGPLDEAANRHLSLQARQGRRRLESARAGQADSIIPRPSSATCRPASAPTAAAFTSSPTVPAVKADVTFGWCRPRI